MIFIFTYIYNALRKLPSVTAQNVGKVVTFLLNNKMVAIFVGLPLLILTMVRTAGELFTTILVKMELFQGEFNAVVSNAPVSSGGFGTVFTSANTILPVIETLQMIFCLASIWLLVLGIQFIVWVWNKIPFKAT